MFVVYVLDSNTALDVAVFGFVLVMLVKDKGVTEAGGFCGILTAFCWACGHANC